MELNFVNKDNVWVAEFEATADFNLHIDGVAEGKIKVYQRGSAGGKYAYVRAATPYPSFSNVYDYDFTSLVYPKFIKVVCATEPSYAEIASNGEAIELKYQDKEIEVTKNGEQIVYPDAGFTALNYVKVKVDIPTEGGSAGDGDAEGANYEYLDLTNMTDNEIIPLMPFCFLGKFDKGDVDEVLGGKAITPISLMYAGGVSSTQGSRWISAVSVDLSAEIKMEGQLLTMRELFSMQGITPEQLASIPRITKEEFYNLG